MKSVFKNRIAHTVIALVVVLGSVNAQSKDDASATLDLYNEIKLQDSLLFTAFNTRDLEAYKNYLNDGN